MDRPSDVKRTSILYQKLLAPASTRVPSGKKDVTAHLKLRPTWLLSTSKYRSSHRQLRSQVLPLQPLLIPGNV